MNKSTEISVVIPVYNSADTIEETLDSVVKQSFTRWEAICVDDGSSDNSIEIISNYIERHPGKHIRVVKREKKEKGGSVCRNIGASLVEGIYLMFLDADDLLAPFCLEQRISAIEGTDNRFVVFPMAAFVNNDLSTAKMYSRLYVKEPLYMFLSGFGTWQVTSPLIRKDFFYSLEGFDESFPRLQDVEFHIRAILESKGRFQIFENAEADCFYRQGNSTAVKVEKLKRTIAGCSKLIDLIERYASQGIIENKKKFSLSILSLYCHISLYQDWIIEQESNFNRINPVAESELYQFMTTGAKIIAYLIDRIRNVKIRIFLSRGIDRMIRSKLAK